MKTISFQLSIQLSRNEWYGNVTSMSSRLSVSCSWSLFGTASTVSGLQRLHRPLRAAQVNTNVCLPFLSWKCIDSRSSRGAQYARISAERCYNDSVRPGHPVRNPGEPHTEEDKALHLAEFSHVRVWYVFRGSGTLFNSSH